MVYLAIILIPFILLFNAYLLGCFVKRWSKSINTYLCSAIGFFIFISILFIFFVLLYISSSTIIGYLISLVVIQAFLIVGYIWNYRYTFLTKTIKIKPLIVFVLIVVFTGLVTTMVITYGYRTNKTSGMEFGNLINNFTDHNYYNRFNESIIFFKDGFNFQNFSVFSIFAVAFKHFLNVKNSDLGIYLYYQQVITLAVVIGWSSVGFAYKLINHNRWWFIAMPTLFALLIVVLSIIFYDSPIVGDVWISIPIILYCVITFNRNQTNEQYYSYLNVVIILSVAALDINLTLLTVILFIFNLVYNSLRNFNTWGDAAYIFFPLLFTIFVWIPLSSSTAYIIVLSLILASAILMAIFSWKIRNSVVFAKANSVFNKHPFALLSIIAVIIYLTSIVLLATVFNYKFNWVLWPKDIYHSAWGIDLSKNQFNYALNVVSWSAIVLFVIGFIIYWSIKRFKLADKPYLAIAVFSVILFVNPLSLNMFSRLQQSKINLFDFGLINYLVIIPLLAAALNFISNLTNTGKEQTLYEQSISQNQQPQI